MPFSTPTPGGSSLVFIQFIIRFFRCSSENTTTLAFLTLFAMIGGAVSASDDGLPDLSTMDRSPVEVAISPSGEYLVTVNQIANSVSLIDLSTRTVVDEACCGEHPIDVRFIGDSDQLLVSAAWSGTVESFAIQSGKLSRQQVIDVGSEPHAIAIAPDGQRAYVGLNASAEVAEIDIAGNTVVRRIAVGNWPKYLAITPDGTQLAVSNGGDSNIMVVDLATGESLYDEPLGNGINLGQMVMSRDGKYVYFPWMVYRTNPISVDNIQRGWVLATRLGRVRLDGPSYREAISLDVPGKAVSDPHDVVISRDGERLVASASGTHELLFYRLTDLPFVAEGGPGDLIERELQRDRERFDRLTIGGRPMGLCLADDDRTLYVANYLTNSVQCVDIIRKELVAEIRLGGPKERTLVRRGMEIFYDGQYSLDQWYSCHTCHQDGGINSRPMDTLNDGGNGSLKTVLPLYHVAETAPWTWHGWQTDMKEAIVKSITSTMQGKTPSEEDVTALHAYLTTLKAPPNPFKSGGKLSDAAERGKKIFFSAKAACADCHDGPHFTDGKIHEVGLESASDRYRGYNTPTLVGSFRRVRFFHNGSARSLEQVLTDRHSPEKVNGEAPLSEQELADLIEYLKTL